MRLTENQPRESEGQDKSEQRELASSQEGNPYTSLLSEARHCPNYTWGCVSEIRKNDNQSLYLYSRTVVKIFKHFFYVDK
jgi:hypothetical protein